MKPLISFIFLILFANANSQRLVVKKASCNFNDGSVCYYTQAGETYVNIHSPPWSTHNYTSAPDGGVIDGPSGLFFKSTSALSLQSPKGLPLNGNYCLTFDYQLSQGQLNIVAKDSGDNTYALFFRQQAIGFADGWQRYVRNLDFRAGQYQITIGVSESVSLDNLLLTSGQCEGPDHSERYCDFDYIVGSRRQLAGEANYFGCDWLTAIGSNTDTWSVRSGQDHSTGSSFGGMLQIARQYSSANPKLVFNMSPEEGAHCFEFWAYGEQAWTVSESAVNTNITNVLLTFNGIERERWQQSMVTVDPVVEMQYQLEISSRTYFQVDSMRLKKGKCPPRAYCDFKNHLCSYFTRSTYNVGAGNLIFSDIDPIPNNRSFYFDLSAVQYRPIVAELTSADIVASGNMCYQVRYRSGMYAEVKIFTQQERVNTLLNSFEDDEDIQKSIFADIYFKVSTNFKIVVQITGHSNTKIVAIDRVSLHVGTCEVLRNPIPKPPIQTDYLCQQSGHYIPRYRTCDGVIDCPMGEDEGEHCQDTSCSHGGIPCTKRGHRFCLVDATQFCDGESDCDDGIDEDSRMCDEQSFCDNFCLNAGECAFNSFSCNCNAPGLGKRCN